MSSNLESQGAASLTAAILAYFDEGSPVAFLPAERPAEISFVGIRRGEIAYGGGPLGVSKDQTSCVRQRVIRELRGFGIAATDVGQDIPDALKAAAIDSWLSRDPSLWRNIAIWFWRQLPYGYVKLRSGNWLPINRDYEPLGMSRGTWADYEAFADVADRFLSHPANLDGIWSDVSARRDRVFLYNDDPASRRGYFTRLLRLEDYVAMPGEVPPLNTK